MKFTFTSFDKAILAAILAPLFVLGTSWVNCAATIACSTPVVWPRDYAAAAVAGLIAGLGVYFKGNKEPA